LYFFIGIPASLQSEFSLTPAGTKTPGQVSSTAYHYINTFLVTSTYPEWLQNAAIPANLNLALEHVQNAYESIREGLPTNPNTYEVQGIISQLKQAKPPREEAEPITREAFVESLAKLIKRGMKFLSADSVVVAVDQALAAARVPEAQREAMTHAALDRVDQSLGINTSIPGDVKAVKGQK
jgi:hypothetical protein